MSLSTSLDDVNKKLATALAHSKDLEKTFEKIAKIADTKLKSGMDNLMGGGGSSGTTAGPTGNIMSASLGTVGTSGNSGTTGAAATGKSNNFGAVNASFGNKGGGSETSGGTTNASATSSNGGNFKFTSGSTNSAASAGGSGGGSAGNGPAVGTDNTGTSRFGGVSILAGLGSAAWQMTPGVADIVTNQSMLFPTAFATAGQYSNKGTNQRILDGINNGASGVFDPVAASAAMTMSGFTMNMGKTQDNMLTAAGSMYKLTGMGNVSSVQGSMALTSGSSGVSNKLMSIGIMTVGDSGNPRDIGAIVDQMWDRFYPNGKKVTEAQLDRDISMGFVGAGLQEFFGDQPALYAQAVQMLRLKAKEGGRSGIRLGLPEFDQAGNENMNSAITVAKKYGYNQYNSPMAAAGDVNTTHGKFLMEASEGGLSGYLKGMDAEQSLASAASAALELAGVFGDAAAAGKAFTETLLANPTTGAAAAAVGSILGGALKIGMGAIMMKAPGGEVTGPGGSVGDKIPAYLSHGEFVVNARAVQDVGVETLHELNSRGQSFGSAYASPARMLNGGDSSDHDSGPAGMRKSVGGGKKAKSGVESYDSGAGMGNAATEEPPRSKNGRAIADYASQFVGVQYVDSAKTRGRGKSPDPKNGWDCSTFTQWVFGKFGINVPNYSDNYLSTGQSVRRDDLQAGDLLLWKTHDEKRTGHVSIYTGNGQHVHAANSRRDTVHEKISKWYWDRYVTARRVTGGTGKAGGLDLNSSGSDSEVNENSNLDNSGPTDVTNMTTDELYKFLRSPDTGSGSSGTSTAGSNQDPMSIMISNLIQSIGGDSPELKTAASLLSMAFGNTPTTTKNRSTDPAERMKADLMSGGTSGFMDSDASDKPAEPAGLNAVVAGYALGMLSSVMKMAGVNQTTEPSETIGGPSTNGESSQSQSDGEVYETPKGRLSKVLTRAGFKGKHHREAWAIAMRESGGNPEAYNGKGRDNSYGIFQINMKGDLEAERNRKFRQYVPGYQNKEDLYDPMINARAAAYMSQKGKNWSSWVSPQYGKAAKYYDEYASSASHGMETVSRDGPVHVHQGEMIFPAAVAQDFRDALREALNGGGSKQPVSISLTIDKASDEEAEKFANKVMDLLDNKGRMQRVGRS